MYITYNHNTVLVLTYVIENAVQSSSCDWRKRVRIKRNVKTRRMRYDNLESKTVKI